MPDLGELEDLHKLVDRIHHSMGYLMVLGQQPPITNDDVLPPPTTTTTVTSATAATATKTVRGGVGGPIPVGFLVSLQDDSSVRRIVGPLFDNTLVKMRHDQALLKETQI